MISAFVSPNTEITTNKQKKYYCEHNRYGSTCVQCGGSSVCEHKRQKSQCKECKGSQICEHNNRRSVCKQCKGGSICQHNRVIYECKQCKHTLICKHNCNRHRCMACNLEKKRKHCDAIVNDSDNDSNCDNTDTNTKKRKYDDNGNISILSNGIPTKSYHRDTYFNSQCTPIKLKSHISTPVELQNNIPGRARTEFECKTLEPVIPTPIRQQYNTTPSTPFIPTPIRQQYNTTSTTYDYRSQCSNYSTWMNSSNILDVSYSYTYITSTTYTTTSTSTNVYAPLFNG